MSNATHFISIADNGIDRPSGNFCIGLFSESDDTNLTRDEFNPIRIDGEGPPDSRNAALQQSIISFTSQLAAMMRNDPTMIVNSSTLLNFGQESPASVVAITALMDEFGQRIRTKKYW